MLCFATVWDKQISTYCCFGSVTKYWKYLILISLFQRYLPPSLPPSPILGNRKTSLSVDLSFDENGKVKLLCTQSCLFFRISLLQDISFLNIWWFEHLSFDENGKVKLLCTQSCLFFRMSWLLNILIVIVISILSLQYLSFYENGKVKFLCTHTCLSFWIFRIFFLLNI